MNASGLVFGIAASAWGSRSAGRKGASPVSASPREKSSVMAVAAPSAWGSKGGERRGAN